MRGRGGAIERGSFHQLHVLNILCRGAGGDFVEPLAFVAVIDAVEFIERVEEMIVAAGAGGGNEAAHRERVDECVVEMLILVGLRGGDVAGFTRRAFGALDGFVFGLGKGERAWIDAELIFGGGANPGLGVDGTAEVTVEVGALGQIDEEGCKFEGIGAHSFECARGAEFRGRCDLRRRGRREQMSRMRRPRSWRFTRTELKRSGIFMAILSSGVERYFIFVENTSS